MEHAKKLVLIEPRVLEQLQAHREYKELSKPADKKSKATLSMKMKKMLEDDTTSDDLKAKLYQQAFRKFKTVRDTVPETDIVQCNTSTAPVVIQRQRQQRQTAKSPRSSQRTKTKSWVEY